MTWVSVCSYLQEQTRLARTGPLLTLPVTRNPAALDVGKATINTTDDGRGIDDAFFVRALSGQKITDKAQQAAMVGALQAIVSSKPSAESRPKFSTDKGSTTVGTLMGKHGHPAAACTAVAQLAQGSPGMEGLVQEACHACSGAAAGAAASG